MSDQDLKQRLAAWADELHATGGVGTFIATEVRQRFLEPRTACEPTAIDLIRAERHRQIAKGYDAAHDDGHSDGQIAKAAASFTCAAGRRAQPLPWSAQDAVDHLQRQASALWPFADGGPDAADDQLDLLAKAGACIIAEMERVTRSSYVCVGCRRRVPNDFGAADNMPDHCDDCWYKAHQKPGKSVDETEGAPR